MLGLLACAPAPTQLTETGVVEAGAGGGVGGGVVVVVVVVVGVVVFGVVIGVVGAG